MKKLSYLSQKMNSSCTLEAAEDRQAGGPNIKLHHDEERENFNSPEHLMPLPNRGTKMNVKRLFSPKKSRGADLVSHAIRGNQEDRIKLCHSRRGSQRPQLITLSHIQGTTSSMSLKIGAGIEKRYKQDETIKNELKIP